MVGTELWAHGAHTRTHLAVCCPMRSSCGPNATPTVLTRCSLQLGFFRRARYVPPAVPQYHAVKIPREERQQYREEKMGTIQRKEWAVNWSEPSDGHVTPSSA